jgi:hypothetical protein
MRFGISTHLYHDQKLGREHLAEVAGMASTASSCSPRAATSITTRRPSTRWPAGWPMRVTLHSVHAPITDAFGRGDAWDPTFSNAAADSARRVAAVRETEAALQIARRIPFEVLVVHLGVPDSRSGDGRQQPQRRSRQERRGNLRARGPLGVRVASR